LSYGQRKRQVKEEPPDEGKEAGITRTDVGCNQDQQERQVQSEAAGLAATKAASKVIAKKCHQI
jgi:hypothetical protein